MNGKSAVIGIVFLFCVRILTAQALGDANKDGKVDIVDALNIARVYVGMDVDNFDAHFGDANLDNEVNIVDSILVAQNYVGIVPVLPAFLNDIGITVDYPANWDIVMKEFPFLTPDQSHLLLENGFLILENKYQDTVSAAYEKYIDEPRLPKFLTIDSLSHIFHLTLSHMNETVERKNLFPALQDFLLQLSDQLRSEYSAMPPTDPFYNAAEKLLIRLIVAKHLIQGTLYNENDLPSHCAMSINNYLQKVRSHDLVDNEEDYTSYTPRGHYANNPNPEYRKLLIRYFLSLTWLQRYILDINEYSDLRQIILFSNLVSQDAFLSEEFGLINDFLTKIKGVSGDFTLEQIELNLLAAQPDSYHLSGYRAFDSYNSILTLSDILENQTGVKPIFRLIPKVETPDMNILKNTHVPNIQDRKWPSGVDVAAGFFDSPAAIQILEDSPYGDQISSVFETFLQEKSDFFDSEINDSLVWRWFKILRDLSYEIPSTTSYTGINLDNWRIKQLNTQLSLWAEYYSDTANYEAPTPTPTVNPTPTSSPVVSPSEVTFRFEPSELTVSRETAFSLKIMLDISGSNLAAYGFNIEYSRDLISVDKSNHPEGVSSGADGFFAAAAFTPSGLLKISGFDVDGIGPGNNLHLLTIDFISNNKAGTTAVSLSINDLTNASGQDLFANECVGFVNISGPGSIRYGDVNGDNAINIVDALLIAQYFVSMSFNTINLEAADVDGNGYVNIVDSLLIAQFYIGLIDNFPGVDSTPQPGVTPTPTYATATPTAEVTPVPSETPEPDSGYQFIEPCSSAFEDIGLLAADLGAFLSQNNIAFDHMEKFYELSEIAMELSAIANDSINNHRLTDTQRDYINDWGFKVSKEYFFIDDLSNFINEHEGNTRVIADIYNYTDLVLNIGVGPLKPILMVMNYPGDNRKYVAIGYILSYYELQDENYTRYTIEEWERKLNQDEIDQPDWIMPLMAKPTRIPEVFNEFSTLYNP